MDGMRAAAWFIAGILCGGLPADLAAAPGEIHFVGTGGASLRAEPGLDAAAPVRLAAGQRLIEFRRMGSWLRVGLLGGAPAQGWVAESEVVTPERAPQNQSQNQSRPSAPEGANVSGGTGPDSPPFRLEIFGRPGLRFKARCRLVDVRGAETVKRFNGQIAQEWRLQAEAVSCRVQKWDAFGRLSLRLWDGDVLVAEISTAAVFNSLAVRSDGPWGHSRSSRGRVKAIGIPPGTAGRSLEPLKGPILRPLGGLSGQSK